jgi:hypothetical protein
MMKDILVLDLMFPVVCVLSFISCLMECDE